MSSFGHPCVLSQGFEAQHPKNGGDVWLHVYHLLLGALMQLLGLMELKTEGLKEAG